MRFFYQTVENFVGYSEIFGDSLPTVPVAQQFYTQKSQHCDKENSHWVH